MTTRTSLPSNDSKRSSQRIFTQLTLAGAAALAGSTANAQVTVVNVNETVGFGAGDVSSITSMLPGSSQFIIVGFGGANSHYFGAFATAGTASLKANKIGGHSYANSPLGKKFSTLAGPTFPGGGLLAISTVHGFDISTLSGTAPTYLSFRFAPTTHGVYDYGWLELSAFTVGGFNGSFTVSQYAYDASGAQLPNGYIPANATFVPEPSAVVALAAFSALALGAVGARRLKALKAAA